MSRQFATNVTTIYDIFCPVPFIPSSVGFRRVKFTPKIESRLQLRLIGRHLVGIWIGGVWNGHFPVPKSIFQRPKLTGTSPKFRRKGDFGQISGSEIENSEPEKMQFHTPRHSIPPLDSLFLSASAKVSHQTGVHTHPLTARVREHWFLQHLSHFIAANFGHQWRKRPCVRFGKEKNQ